MKDYTKTFLIGSNVDKCFKALTKEIPNWWGTQKGESVKVGDKMKILYWEFEIIELIENQKIIWKCIKADHIDVSKEAEKEWEDTQIVWELTMKEENLTQIMMTHIGLNSSLVCYDVCKPGWDYFLNSLKKYLETGKGTPVEID